MLIIACMDQFVCLFVSPSTLTPQWPGMVKKVRQGHNQDSRHELARGGIFHVIQHHAWQWKLGAWSFQGSHCLENDWVLVCLWKVVNEWLCIICLFLYSSLHLLICLCFNPGVFLLLFLFYPTSHGASVWVAVLVLGCWPWWVNI